MISNILLYQNNLGMDTSFHRIYRQFKTIRICNKHHSNKFSIVMHLSLFIVSRVSVKKTHTLLGSHKAAMLSNRSPWMKRQRLECFEKPSILVWLCMEVIVIEFTLFPCLYLFWVLSNTTKQFLYPIKLNFQLFICLNCQTRSLCITCL